MSIHAFYTVDDGSNPVSVGILRILITRGVYARIYETVGEAKAFADENTVAVYDSSLGRGCYTFCLTSLTPADKRRPEWVGPSALSILLPQRPDQMPPRRYDMVGHQFANAFFNGVEGRLSTKRVGGSVSTSGIPIHYRKGRRHSSSDSC